METPDRAQRLSRIAAHDRRLFQMEVLNQELERVGAQLEEAWEALRPLIAYYREDWMADHDDFDDDPDGQFGVLSEDGVWNEMTTFRATLVDVQARVARILAEYEASGQ